MPTTKKGSKVAKGSQGSKVAKGKAAKVKVAKITKEPQIPQIPENPQVSSQRKVKYFFAVGRRKTSTCTVRLYEKGKGEIEVNNKPFKAYFAEPYLEEKILAPLALVGKDKAFDITIKASGGGKMSQAVAVRLGIARAPVVSEAELRTTLKREGFLTRDPRAKERKKYGLKRARKAPQFSKR